MKDAVEDLRIIRLAQMYEEAYERFAKRVAEDVQDPGVRAKLGTLAPLTDSHADRLRGMSDRIRSGLSAEDQEELERAILLDVVETERAAREFYLHQVDRVHDPALAKLFTEIMHEEAGHVRIAKAAVDLHKTSGRARPASP